MKIKKTFLNLTKKTYPHGTENQTFGFLPKMETDPFGNKFCVIGSSSTMFTSHLDTASQRELQVNHVMDYPFIQTDGTSLLGADDKAGVTIMLYMISKKVPGLYYFFLGEESGCIGSKALSGLHRTNPLTNIKKVISFDRRNYHSVITHQLGGRCCSDTFANALSKELNESGIKEKTIKNWKLSYTKDNTGIYTDSAQFTRIYPECTNISVGYFSEHTTSERQNILHLEKLAKSCVFVDWENLPTERDPSKIEYDNYGYGWGDDFYDDCPRDRSFHYPTSTPSTFKGAAYYVPESENEEKIIFWDAKYNHTSILKVDKTTGDITGVDIAKERIEEEQIKLQQILTDLEMSFKKLEWNGSVLKIEHKPNDTSETTRQDLVSYFPGLEFWISDRFVMGKLSKIKNQAEEAKELLGIL